jgi:hypothetical protein
MNTVANGFGKWKARLSNDFILFDLFTLTFLFVSAGDIWSSFIPDPIGLVAALIWIAITVTLIFKKRTDEFSAQCWNSATASAFALVVMTPFLAGLIEGFTGEHRNDASYKANVEEHLWVAQVAIFIVVLQWNRLRGTFS